MLEVLVAKLKIRPGPVRPEMTQVGADQIRPAVDELRGQAELMERLEPELLLGPRAEDALAAPRQGGAPPPRRAETRALPARALCHPAADVISGEHGPGQPQFLDQRD